MLCEGFSTCHALSQTQHWSVRQPVVLCDKNTFLTPFVSLKVTRLCDLSVEGDSVTSVGWSERVSMTLSARTAETRVT